jgi:Domain of unknown function (DUF4156)
MLKKALFVVSVVLPGCLANVVTLEPKAEGIKVVHDSDKPLRCDVLGKISGTSRSDDEKAARTGAENDFRNHAAELKANFAFIEAERSGPVGTSSQHDVFIGGKALRCQTEAMEEADDKAAASAHEQKEKEDAEREQKEADEKKAAKDKKHGKK